LDCEIAWIAFIGVGLSVFAVVAYPPKVAELSGSQRCGFVGEDLKAEEQTEDKRIFEAKGPRSLGGTLCTTVMTNAE
jgi:hypothetical protein